MKYLLMAVLLVTGLCGGNFVYAADTKATDTQQDKAFQDYMTKMQEQMKLMQDQMQKMQQTTDPNERQKLMQEHWTAMQEGMRMMHGAGNMPGCGMMMGDGMGCCGAGGMHGMGWWNSKDASPQAMNRRQQMLGACMGMQQQIMDHMMWQQDMWMRGRP